MHVNNQRVSLNKKNKVREKSHRLARVHYQGLITVAFTLCIKDRVHCFTKDAVVSQAVSLLTDMLERQKARAMVYCFMPDHVHLILEGREADSDLWKAVVDFKQQMGFWFSKNLPNVE
jgi:putative transposase